MIKKYFLIGVSIFISNIVFAQVDSIPADSLLLLQIQAQMQNTSPTTPEPPPRTVASTNPEISVIGDFQSFYQSYQQPHFGATLNEVEFSFQATIDPYAKAEFYYSVGRNPDGTFTNGIEEGFLTTLSLPAHLQLKAGRFKESVGRVNITHSHALPFIDMPNAYVNFFGEEGLKDDGFSLSWLIPNRLFYQELTCEITNGPLESPSFNHNQTNNLMKLVHLKNFWDLNANSTLELGLTGLGGANNYNHNTNMGAVDLTFKWKPVRFNTYKSITFQNELYYSNAKIDSATTVNALGFYSMLSVQVAKRIFVTGRYDYSNKPESATYKEQAGSLTFGWLATEFQKIEFEVKQTNSNQPNEEFNLKQDFTQVYMRWIFVIGSHGAHKY